MTLYSDRDRFLQRVAEQLAGYGRYGTKVTITGTDIGKYTAIHFSNGVNVTYKGRIILANEKLPEVELEAAEETPVAYEAGHKPRSTRAEMREPVPAAKTKRLPAKRKRAV